MLRLTASTPARGGVVSLVFVACAAGAACGEGSPDTQTTTGGAAPLGGSDATGALPSGATGGLATGGNGAVATGGVGAFTTGGSGALTTGGYGGLETGGSGALATGGVGALATGGVGAFTTGGSGALTTGGYGGLETGGAETSGAAGTGAQSCIPANPNGPADHMTAGYDTQPCSSCHGAALVGGVIYDPAGTARVAQATVTITPTDGGPLTAVTGSTGMFYFWDAIPAPYQVCVSRCPDTICSTEADHQSGGDCATCHGVTTPEIHFP